MKATVEWKDQNVWKQVHVNTRLSRNGNQFFTIGNVLYVFQDFKDGTQVVRKTGGGPWLRAGRITRNIIFLGKGLS